MDPAKFIRYTTQLSTELLLLANAGHRQFVTGQAENGESAFIIATGPEEAAMLRRVMELMDADPAFCEFRAKRQGKAETDLVAAISPEAN